MEEALLLRALFQHWRQIVTWTCRTSTERTVVVDCDLRNMGSSVTVTRYLVSVTEHSVVRGGSVVTSDRYWGDNSVTIRPVFVWS